MTTTAQKLISVIGKLFDENKKLRKNQYDWAISNYPKGTFKDKLVIPSEMWVQMYSDLSTYIEYKCFPGRKTHDEYGQRTEESEDDFLEIVENVEEIMSNYFIKGEL
tara:strand:- start:28 stop:348 length:321 start_codon:yes stop_codon:yes gene_type:complete